ARTTRGPARKPPSAAFRAGPLARQLHHEPRARAGRALDPHLAAVGLDELAHDPQAEPEPAEAAVRDGALEPLEDPGLVLEGDPDPLIGDGDAGARPALLDAHPDRLARAELERVAQQVRQHLIE